MTTSRLKNKSSITPEKISIAVRLLVLLWSAGLLTASYFKITPQIDSTFIAGLFTSTLGTFGIQAVKNSEESKPPKV